MKQKFCFFDFDDTLIHGSSGTMLIRYYLKKHPLGVIYLIPMAIVCILYVLKLASFNQAKSATLFPLNRMSEKEVQAFFEEEVEKHYYPHVIEELKKKKEEGYVIYICSASVEAYLRYCRLPVDAILGTKTVIKNNHYTGKMIGKNCKNEEKINRIMEVIKNHNLEIDYDQSFAYSDSKHDIPMLKMVKNRVKIDTKDGHMSPFIIE